jgi:hypothetical protein
MRDEVGHKLVLIGDWLWINMIGFRESPTIASRGYNRNVLRVHWEGDRSVCSRTEVDEDFSVKLVKGRRKTKSVRMKNKRR